MRRSGAYTDVGAIGYTFLSTIIIVGLFEGGDEVVTTLPDVDEHLMNHAVDHARLRPRRRTACTTRLITAALIRALTDRQRAEEDHVAESARRQTGDRRGEQ